MSGFVYLETYQPDKELDRLKALGLRLQKPFVVASPIDSNHQCFYAGPALSALAEKASGLSASPPEFLRTLLDESPFDYVMRIFPFGHEIPPALIQEVEKTFLSKGTYSCALGEEIGLVFVVECLTQNDLARAAKAHSFFLPGLQINATQNGTFERVWLDTALRQHFFKDRFEKCFIPPPSLTFEISNVCNLRCLKCPFHSPRAIHVPASSWGQQQKFIDLGTVVKSMEQIAGWEKKPSIYLGGDGESLIHKNIESIIAAIAGAGTPLTVTTNGVLLEGRVAEQLAAADANIVASIDCLDPESYLKFTGKNYYNRVVDNLINYKKRIDDKASLTIAFVEVDGFNETLFDEFRDFWLDKGTLVKKIVKMRLFDHAKKFYHDLGLPQTPFTCNQPFLQLRILTDGTVSPCCVTHPRNYRLGNVSEEPLLDLWHNKNFQAFRDSFFGPPYFNRHCLEHKCWMWVASARHTQECEGYIKSTYTDFKEYRCK